MLDFRRDTLDYGRQLNPPPGYQLERAVCTTYSLDLLALLAIPVALFYRSNLDEGASGERMDILDAIQRSADKLVVYCQKGKIAVPHEAGKSLCFIEDCVREVLPADARTSFHPKVWVVSYSQPDGPTLFRVLIGSRNLTMDRSWDVAFFLEGHVTKDAQPANEPLIDLMKWLTARKDFAGSEAFIDQLRRADLVVEEPFRDFAFHPMGIPGHRNPLLTAQFTDLLVISPFVDVRALRTLCEVSSGKRWLFSRREELDRMPLSALSGFEAFAFSQRVEEGEADEELRESGKDVPLQQQLHAKLFVGSESRGQVRWYLGSANSTGPALDRNQEMLVMLQGREAMLSPAEMAKELTGTASGLQVFEPYKRTSEGPNATVEFDYRPAVHALLLALDKGVLRAECMASEVNTGQFDILLRLAPALVMTKDITCTVAPLGYGSSEQLATGVDAIRFSGLGLFQLSPFLRWTLRKGTDKEVTFLTRMEVELPPDRKDAVFRSFVDTTDKFFQFIRFLLGEGESDIFFTQQGSRNGHGNGPARGGNTQYPLLEELMVAASRHPERLVAIESVVQRMQKSGHADLVPPDFLGIWEQFKPFAHG
ncbi:MAG: phospholipase D family protein [Flavobacteriales bacterium]